MGDYPTLNGVAQSWADLTITIDVYGAAQIDAEDVKDISWKRSVERGEQRKTGGQLRARTAGQASYECTITFYASGYHKLIAALGAAAVAGGYVDSTGAAQLSKVGWSTLVQHAPEGVDKPRKVSIQGCSLDEDGSDMSEGTDADTMATNVSPRRIETTDENGVRAVLV
jgi:hypothetical protein